MKLVAIVGDTHADETSRFEEHNRIMHWIGEDAAARGVDLFIHTGDVWERKSTGVERLAVATYLREWSSVAPVVVVCGNHDSLDDVRLLNRLETDHRVYGVTEPQTLHVAGFEVPCLPWPRRSALAAAVGPVSQEETEDVAKVALQNVLRGLDAPRMETRIFAGHVMVRGSVTSTGQPLVGHDFELGLEDLALCQADFYALGHIHKGEGNEWDVAGSPAVYPGSPRRVDFGETEEKGYIVATFDDDGSLVGWERVPTPARPMIHLDGAWNETDRQLSVEWDEEKTQGAEVRLRYRVAVDQRVQARTQADAFRAAILECGAASVKLDEVPVVVKRARAPEVSRRKTIGEKLEAHWESVGYDPGGRRNPLLSKARKLEESVGASSATAPTWLRLNSTRLRNIGPHADFSYDFQQHDDAPVIAVTGPNGTGKTTMLEMAIAGACYRTTPTQSTPIKRATAKDSMVESRITAGDRTWTLRHTLDGATGKAEALVLDEDGNPVMTSTKVSEFDKWAARFLPDPSILFATTFSSQPGGKTRPRFIDADSADAISILLRTLGIERIEAMAQAARAKERDALQEHEVARSRVADAQERAGDPEEHKRAVGVAEDLLRLREEELKQARELLERVEARAKVAEQENLRREALRNQRDALQEDLRGREAHLRRLKEEEDLLRRQLWGMDDDRDVAATLPQLRCDLEAALSAERDAAEVATRNQSARERIRELEDELQRVTAEQTKTQEKLDSFEALLERREEIEGAAADMERLRADGAALLTELAVSESASNQLRVDLGRMGTDLALAQKDLADAEPRAGRVEDARRALEQIPAARRRLDASVADRDAARAELEALQSTQVAGATERIQHLRSGLGRIVESPDRGAAIASTTLDIDTATAKAAEELPAKLAAARKEVLDAERNAADDRERFEELDRLALGVQDAEEAHAAWERLGQRVAELVEAREALTEKLAATTRATEELRGREQAARRLRLEAEATAGLLGPLESAQRDHADLSERLRQGFETTARISKQIQEKRGLVVDVPRVSPTSSDVRQKLRLAEAAAARVAEAAETERKLSGVAVLVQETTRHVRDLEAKVGAFEDAAPVSAPSVAGARLEVDECQTRLQDAKADLAVAQSRLNDCSKSQGAVRKAFEECDRLAAEHADWKRLADDLGRGGVQSAEVDSAGPELTDLCNELLRECHGNRFSVSIDTTRLSADGKKTLDEFQVTVLDTERGGERPARHFSGGERVLLGEVVENALLMLGCRRADARNPTIVRDESGAALDPANTRAYWRMLKHVVRKTGAAHLLLVTHSQELQELADVRIDIGAGALTRGAAE